MKLSYYYKKGVLVPALIAFAIAVVFSIIDNYDYKSEWLTAGGVIYLEIMYAFIYCGIISIFSLSIFLNNIHNVRKSKLLSLLACLLLPCSFIGIILIHEIIQDIQIGTYYNELIYEMILNVPFIFGLIWSYLKYNKNKSTDQLV